MANFDYKKPNLCALFCPSCGACPTFICKKSKASRGWANILPLVTLDALRILHGDPVSLLNPWLLREILLDPPPQIWEEHPVGHSPGHFWPRLGMSPTPDPSSGKEGCGVQKPPFPLVLEEGVFCQKIPFFLQGNTAKMGFLTEKSDFPARVSWELRDIYHHHPESKKRKSSEANSAPSTPAVDMEML